MMPNTEIPRWRKVLAWFYGCALLAIIVTTCAHAACPPIVRSQAVLRQFQRLHPCPSTGKTTGPCKNWVRDHRWPLCAGGSDTLDNLVWSPKAEASLKDQWERMMCRRLGCAHRGE
jgi:hypothetical protein